MDVRLNNKEIDYLFDFSLQTWYDGTHSETSKSIAWICRCGAVYKHYKNADLECSFIEEYYCEKTAKRFGFN